MTGPNGHAGPNGTGSGPDGHLNDDWDADPFARTDPNLGANNGDLSSHRKIDGKVDAIVVAGRYYTRTTDGQFVDPHGQTADLDKLFPPPPPEENSKYPWIHPIEPPAYVDWAALDGTPVPKQEWVVPGWIPRWETTGLVGAGGVNKTTLAQQLATGGAIGMPWMKIDLPFFKTFAVLCEDRLGDVRRRQEKINRAEGISERDLADRMRVWPRRRGTHNYLMMFDRDGFGHTTSFFDQVLAEVKAFEADLVILDTKADLFFGNQNDENQARTFVRQCTDRIAEEAKCAVLLIYHPSRSGMRDGTWQSGSVQWDGAFRGRLVLMVPEPEEDGVPVDEDARVLTRVKSTFARKGEEIQMKWEDGVLVRTDQPAPVGITADAKKQKADRVFRQLYEENRTLNHDQPLSNVVTAPRYAPKVFAAHPHSEKVSKKDFEGAMRRALAMGGGFEMAPYGPPSDQHWRIVKVVENST